MNLEPDVDGDGKETQSHLPQFVGNFCKVKTGKGERKKGSFEICHGSRNIVNGHVYGTFTCDENVKKQRKVSWQESRQMPLETSVAEYEERIPDGGWSWVVLIGASLIVVLVDISCTCYGIIFSYLLLDLGTSTYVTSWIFDLLLFLQFVTAFPLGPLINIFGWRKLTFLGSILLTMATVTTAFAKASWILFFTYSLLAGIGTGILCNISHIIVLNYFKERRGLANGILMTWECSGQLIGPLLIQKLQYEYNFTGATMILGGIFFHCCIGAAVYHPAEWHYKPINSLNSRTRRTSKFSSLSTPISNKENAICRTLIKETINNLFVLKSLRAVVLSASYGLFMVSYFSFLALIPFAIREAGHSRGEDVLCITISAICNVLTRIAIAFISDKKKFSFYYAMIFGSFTGSVTMACFTLTETQSTMLPVIGLWAIGSGIYYSLSDLSMVHFMGIDNLDSLVGTSRLFTAVDFLIIGPLAGYIRDVTQSYTLCTWFLASMMFMASLLWVSMPVAEAYDLRKMTEYDNKNKKNWKEDRIEFNEDVIAQSASEQTSKDF